MKSMTKFIVAGSLVALALVAYLLWARPQPLRLDNAFVAGRVIRIASPNAGMVEAINLSRFTVQLGGKAAFTINAQSTLERVKAAELALRNAFSEAGQTCLKLDRQMERIKLNELTLKHADDTVSDAQKLFEQGFVSKRNVEQQQMAEASAKIAHQMEVLEGRRLEMEMSNSVPGSRSMIEAINKLREALAERRRSVVKVDSDIFVQDIHVLPGQWVDEGAPLATVVPIDTMRVQANIIESQIGRVQVGQKAAVTIDGLGKLQVLRGHVEAIVPATAATFSQVQRNTADSTWMKVSQRIPVMIRIDDGMPVGALHVGQSAEVVLQPIGPDKPAASTPTMAAASVALDLGGVDEEMRARLTREGVAVRNRLRLPASCQLFRLE